MLLEVLRSEFKVIHKSLKIQTFSGLSEDLDDMSFDSGTMLETMDTLTTSDHTSVVSITLFVTLLCACIVIGHLLEENRWMNESITALIIVSNFSYFLQVMRAFSYGHLLFGVSISFFMLVVIVEVMHPCS